MKSLLSILSLLINMVAIAQFGPEIILDPSANSPSSVHCADLDNDGHVDVLIAEFWEGVSWMKNNGDETFGPKQSITTGGNGCAHVTTADLNNDGFLDVISATVGLGKVVWYQNLGGVSFSDFTVVTGLTDAPNNLSVGDCDQDGDLDIAITSWTDDRVAWCENEEDGSSWLFHQINLPDIDGDSQNDVQGDIDGPNWVSFADLDNDGDLDILFTSWYDSKSGWYVNDGSGNFGEQNLLAQEEGFPLCILALDADLDGDLDVVSNSYENDQIIYFESLGASVYAEPQIVGSSIDGPYVMASGDIDSDGLVDLIINAFDGNSIHYFRNIGSGEFVEQSLVSDNMGECRYVEVSDLTGNGVLDIVAAAPANDKVSLFANMVTTTDIPQTVLEDTKLTVFPNPSSGSFELTLPNGFQPSSIQVLDLTGRVCLIVNINSLEKGINISELGKGEYILECLNDLSERRRVRIVIH